VGGPGRGKTAIAVLMGVLAGYNLNELKRAIQHGQPQMTIADLLGNPLPSTLVNAKSMDEVQIAWRRWLGMRVKIIDEYNRIPTRTQSALLTVMADNYAELYDQIFECPPGAWVPHGERRRRRRHLSGHRGPAGSHRRCCKSSALQLTLPRRAAPAGGGGL
jgi:MoxR-like ATPase